LKSKNKSLLGILKILFTLALLYVVFTKIEFEKIQQVLSSAKLFPLLLAGVFFIFSQWVSAERLHYLLVKNNFTIAKKSNYAFYLLGMFYNFFIPGGIGGDAYKVYAMHSKFGWSVKKLTSVLFLDRLSGLAAIGMLSCVLALAIPQGLEFIALTLATLLGGLGFFYWILKKFFPSFIPYISKALTFSMLIQGLQILCLIALMYSVSQGYNFLVYSLVFLVSSALSIFSFSGIGIRELIFYQAATLFSFDSTMAVTIGFLFSFITAVISLFGMFYHVKRPNLKLKS
jgi:uncharacterized membrane protein YbhN (UPF0104 family)